MEPEFLAVLRCPACRSELSVRLDSRLYCAACRRSYPVRDEIPVLLLEEARIEPVEATGERGAVTGSGDR